MLILWSSARHLESVPVLKVDLTILTADVKDARLLLYGILKEECVKLVLLALNIYRMKEDVDNALRINLYGTESIAWHVRLTQNSTLKKINVIIVLKVSKEIMTVTNVCLDSYDDLLVYCNSLINQYLNIAYFFR